ncbi:MAG: GNAT family N-acetyltransferase [Pseudomonadota bacterium]
MDDEKIDVVITYLEQRQRPMLPTPHAPPVKTAILRAEAPPTHFYRYLYDQIGAPHNWVSRRALSDEALSAIIHHPDDHIFVLYVGGVPAGLAEIDARSRETVELKFFGLVPEYVGAGYGRYFLTHAIDAAWAFEPQRVILETCSLDHPAALPLYQKLGFTVFDQRTGRVEMAPEFKNAALRKNRP